jgi:hypothetical protein
METEMNDRFKELAEQARKKPMGNSWCYTDPREFEQKFAESIVQECARLANEETSLPYDSYGEKIRKNFGVEE